jgi:3-mercaptopyruvate sulfurtransferase SseA
MQRGYRDVFALQGGWNAWLEAGYPTEPTVKAEPVLAR